MQTMTGLLATTESPKCPDGHGPMQREAGFWALQGVDKVGDGFRINNNGMIFKVWTCSTCKLARIYADDQGE